MPLRPSFDVCDVTARTYQVHDRANTVHDDSLRPFDQDAEERQHDDENQFSRDITYDPQVELEGESDEAERAHVVKDQGMPTTK